MAPTDTIGRFLNVFTGNSTAIFIICAGMGVSLMTNRNEYSNEEKAALKSRILKRSWFLFALGLLLYNWWSGDILHFYGGYMHLAAFLLFVPKRYYLWFALLAIFIFHILLFIIPIDTGWDFTTFAYNDFWTPNGFLRNTFYNGWNAIFPWISYFLLGMWLGRKNWADNIIRRNVFVSGLLLFIIFQGLRGLVRLNIFDAFWSDYIMAEYFPPYIPFVMITIGFALMVIPVCMYIGEKYSNNSLILALQKTGQMTLSHYVIHLTVGMILFAYIANKHYTGSLGEEAPTQPLYILAYSILFYVMSIMFSLVWTKKYTHGPLEMVMRKISN